VISVTEHAKNLLKTLLIDMEAEPDKGLRLLPMPEGEFVLILDTQTSDDQVIEYEGSKVLLIGIEYARFFNNKTVDYKKTEEGEVLLVR
jgi:Fe-S cluster assembly iron-binding protein IscA